MHVFGKIKVETSYVFKISWRSLGTRWVDFLVNHFHQSVVSANTLHFFTFSLSSKLIVLDTTTGRKLEIPKLQNAKTPCHKSPCGIHCVCVNQDHRFLATGGNNPNDLAVYSLPTMDPVVIGEVS